MERFNIPLILVAGMFLAACTTTLVASNTSDDYWKKRLDPREYCKRYDMRDESDKAVRCYEEVMHANPDSPDAHYFLGVAYVWAGDEKSTLREYKAIRKVDIGHAALLIDTIYHVQPEWINRYYEEEIKRIEEAEASKPPHGAAQRGDEAMADLPLARDTDIKARDNMGRSMLHLAASSGNTAMINHLINVGISVHDQDDEGNTPLHAAARYAMRESIEMLVKHGANVNSRNKSGEAPLHSLIHRYFGTTEQAVAVIDSLVQYGADINAVDEYERTVLHYAVFPWVTDEVIFEKLLQRGANINAVDGTGRTPLHYVVQQRSEEADGQQKPLPIAELLIRHGSVINSRNSEGKTPLHSATLNRAVEMVGLLLKHGADQNAIHPDSGRTPREMTQNPEVLKQFDKYLNK